MSDLEFRLNAVLREDAVRDALFRVDVLARLERRRFRRRVICAVALAVVVTALVTVIAPRVDVWIPANVYLLAIVAAVAAFALLALSRVWLSRPAGATEAMRWLYP
jgi:hypothetical protein